MSNKLLIFRKENARKYCGANRSFNDDILLGIVIIGNKLSRSTYCHITINLLNFDVPLDNKTIFQHFDRHSIELGKVANRGRRIG